ncbi:hypothetical protein G9A89_016352 [Geosiphon pyriformis]|nr:hypothetical protein G9A89_016352 [Geosiphon pyriformis]
MIMNFDNLENWGIMQILALFMNQSPLEITPKSRKFFRIQEVQAHATKASKKSRMTLGKQKDTVDWNLLIKDFPFNLTNSEVTQNLVTTLSVEEVELAGYETQLINVERVNNNTFSVVDDNLHQNDSELSSFSSSPASSSYQFSEESDGENADDELDSGNDSDDAIIISHPRKKMCGAMWRPECRRAGRCSCYDKFMNIENQQKSYCSDEDEWFQYRQKKN